MNNTSAGLPTRLWAERMANRASISARGRFPSFPKCPDWLWGSFHGGEAAVVCSGELACTKVKIRGAIPPFSHLPSWGGA